MIVAFLFFDNLPEYSLYSIVDGVGNSIFTCVIKAYNNRLMRFMKKGNILFGVLLLVVSIFISCEQDETSIQVPTPVQTEFFDNFGSSTTARFFGTVVNENNEAVEGVSISVGGMNALTDVNGVFTIQDASVYEKFAYIKAIKAGYINGSRALVPTSGVNQVKIMLLAEDIIATINSGESSEVSLPNGTQVNFEGDFIKSNGADYSGAVSVIMKHLDPTDENVGNMMPGMLYAEDASGNEKVLETFGMLAVELKGTSGEKLQLAEGSTAQIELPVSNIATNAPQTIPLWHFDEVNGYWKEEGFATLTNGKYVGEVSHFSFWNCDVQLPLVQLCINVVDPSGNPIGNQFFTLNRTSTPSGWGANAYSWTNENGYACGQVPIDEELNFIMDVTNCNVPFETIIGSFNIDTTITVVVDANYTSMQLTGVFNDCNGSPVTDGYIQFNHNNSVQYISVTNGIIDHSYSYCGNVGDDFSAQGIDMGGQQTTTVISGLLSANTDLGIITSCGTFEDTDGDGVFDEFEDLNQDNDYTNDDTDQDGIPNYNDTDDDGDGVLTADEDINNDGDFTNDDTDGDGVANYLDVYDVNANYATAAECDNDSNGVEVFDLASLDVNVIGNQTDVTVAYYVSSMDAENENNPLSSPYTSASAIVFSRVNHNSLPYFRIGEVSLVVQTCNLNQPQQYFSCEDTPGSGISCIINLDQTTYILNGNVGSVTYHQTQVDADSGANAISNINSYCNVLPYSEIIYIRVDVGGNITVMSTSVYLDPLPNITLVSTTCEAGNTTYSLTYSSDQYLEWVWANDGTATVDQVTGLGFTISGIPINVDFTAIDVYPQGCPNNTVYVQGPAAPTCN